MTKLSLEITKSLIEDSKFTPDMISMAIDKTKAKLQQSEEKLAQLNYEINNSQDAMKNLDYYYDQFRS